MGFNSTRNKRNAIKTVLRQHFSFQIGKDQKALTVLIGYGYREAGTHTLL